MTRIPPSTPDDQFNDAIEAMLHGDRSGLQSLDTELESTIDQLFDWAERSGFADEPPTWIAFVDPDTTGVTGESPVCMVEVPEYPGPVAPNPAPSISGLRQVDVEPNSDIPVRKRPHPLVAIVSSIAALLLIGLAAYGTRPFFTDHDGESRPTSVSFAAANATPSPTVVPSPTPYPTKAPDPSFAYVVPPLTGTDCTTTPRSRDEVLSILSTPPGLGAVTYYGNLVADQGTIDEINALLRNWESCAAYGMTSERMAYESDQFLRETVYGSPWIKTAFSPSTLNELLDAQAAADAERVSKIFPEWSIVTIDPSSTVWITPESGPILTIRADVIVVSPQTGERENGPYSMAFVYEDGGWKIRWLEPGSLSFFSS